MALGTPDQLWNCLGPLKIETRTISRAVSADRGEITPGTYVPRTSVEFSLMAAASSPIGFGCRDGTEPVEKPPGTTDQKPALESAGLSGPVESDYPLSLLSRESCGIDS